MRTAADSHPRRRRSYRWIVVTLLVALAILLPASGCWLYLLHDGSPPDDSDLLVEVPIVRPEENGYLLLKDRFDWFLPGGALTDALYDIDGGNSRIKALETLEAGVRLPAFQFVEEPFSLGSSSLLIQWVGGFLADQARSFASQGRIEKALEEVWRILRLARKMRSSARHGDDLSLVSAVEGCGLGILQDLLAGQTLPRAALCEFRDELSAEGAELEATHRAILGSYSVLLRSLEHFERSGKLPGFHMSNNDIAWPWAAWKFLLPNSSRSLAAEIARVECKNARRFVKDWIPVVQPPYAYYGWRRFLPVRNGIGKFKIASWAGWSSSVHQYALCEGSHLRARRRLTVAWLALKLHHADRGSFPADLDSLVPQYLPSVPIDPYDGQPLRYSAEKRIVYSIGDDLKDGGGSPETDFKKSLQDSREPTLRLDATGR